MKLTLVAPDIDTPNFLAFCKQAPVYAETLKRIEQRKAVLFTAKEAEMVEAILLHFSPVDKQDEARAAINACSPRELAEAIGAIGPALQKLLEDQIPSE